MRQALIEIVEAAETVVRKREKPSNYDPEAAARKGIDWRPIAVLVDDVPGIDETLGKRRETIRPNRVEYKRHARAMTQDELDARDTAEARQALEEAARAVDLTLTITEEENRTILSFLMEAV